MTFIVILSEKNINANVISREIAEIMWNGCEQEILTKNWSERWFCEM